MAARSRARRIRAGAETQGPQRGGRDPRRPVGGVKVIVVSAVVEPAITER